MHVNPALNPHMAAAQAQERPMIVAAKAAIRGKLQRAGIEIIAESVFEYDGLRRTTLVVPATDKAWRILSRSPTSCEWRTHRKIIIASYGESFDEGFSVGEEIESPCCDEGIFKIEVTTPRGATGTCQTCGRTWPNVFKN